MSYGHDHDRTYRFNALGFRGPEFDHGAEHRIYAFGESHAFGYFVDAEESWPARFAQLLIEAKGLAEDEVCFQNFADVGAPNSGVARAVLTQCAAAPPDLVLVHFGDHRRGEVFLEGRPHRLGPWLLEDATVDAAPASGPTRLAYLEQIERGRAFYRFALGEGWSLEEPFSIEREATCLDATLRSILLVQHFCRAQSIPVVATFDRADVLFRHEVRSHPSLGPLLEQVDPAVLGPLRIWDIDGDRAADEGHAGPERHDRFARALLRRHLGLADPSSAEGCVPEIVPSGERVRRFYDEIPFNHWRSASAAAESLVDGSALESYPDLVALLDTGEVRSTFEAGCGGGWLSASLAKHHGVAVTAVDFSASSLSRARELAAELGVGRRIRFMEADLVELELDTRFDLVISLGVLHHIADPRAAFARISRSVRPGGYFYVGLYHEPGRRPFLRHFRQLQALEGDEAAFEDFRRRFGERGSDEAHLRSWFRDQVLHPQESQHTLGEVCLWLDDLGLKLLSSSINRFEPFRDRAELLGLEQDYAERSRLALDDGRFFPGFFTVLARRPG
ncbi:MAG: class I SAM-dependent methyltransferase [Acidobacteriota bacterium]